MTTVKYMVFGVLVSIWLFTPSGAFPRSGLDSRANRTRRDIHCREHEEYPHGNICCLNCPAGTRLTSACTRAGQKGRCEECDDGTYTEHSSDLKHCFKCTQCRPDQETVRPCTHTQDTECQCKAGRFCVPEEACEVCKKCSRCEEGEETVRNCTSTANTVCKKIPAPSGSVSVIAVILPLTLLAAGVFIGVCVWKRRRKADSQRSRDDEPKAHDYSGCSTEEPRNAERSRSSLILSRQLVRPKSPACKEDERRGLCESLNSSASNSQHSLTCPQPYALPTPPPQVNTIIPRRPDTRWEWVQSTLVGTVLASAPRPVISEDEPLPELFPVNGEESLKKCFGYFEEMNMSHLKRFFRSLDLSDNMIQNKEHLDYEDKIHELLNVWLEKEGMKASLNHLLKALIDLDQRLTAENIMEKAIRNGHYHRKEQ